LYFIKFSKINIHGFENIVAIVVIQTERIAKYMDYAVDKTLKWIVRKMILKFYTTDKVTNDIIDINIEFFGLQTGNQTIQC
jgi:hypothetical protein